MIDKNMRGANCTLNKGTLDTTGLMAYLAIGRNNAQALMRRPDFPSVRISPRRRIVSIAALEEWLSSKAREHEI